MKRILLGTFYTLQGIGNFTFALFLVTRRAAAEAAAIGIILGIPLFLASCFSLLAALELFKRHGALGNGIVSSGIFILFYGCMAFLSYDSIMHGYYNINVAIFLLLSVVIVGLNALSIFFLYSLAKDKRKLPKLSLFF